jgi:hypothetical protein
VEIAASRQKGWVFDYAMLNFAREPSVKIRMPRHFAVDIAGASGGALQIGAA